MKNFRFLSLLSVAFSLLITGSACQGPAASGGGTAAFTVVGKWQVTRFFYRENDETNAFVDTNFVIHEKGSNPEITFKDINSVAETYGSYTYDAQTPDAITMDITGISKGHFFPNEWTFVIHDNNHVTMTGGVNRSGIQFNTEIDLERLN